MRQHHYLGALPKIGETLWYVAVCRHEWVALLSFSASALKCEARDRWIGWDFRLQYGRLKLIVNNSRFLIYQTGMFQTWDPVFCRSAKGVCLGIGNRFLGIPSSCWKPLWTLSVSGARSIGRITGCM